MADSNINFNVSANTLQAQKAFGEFTNILNETKKAASGLSSFWTGGVVANSVSKEMDKIGDSADIMAQRMHSARIANVGFVRVVQDAPFFMRDFNFGVMAISNNIPMFVDGMVAARKATNNWGQAIKLALTGVSPWLTVINLAVSGILAYTLAASNAKKETETLTKELKDSATELEKLYNVVSSIAVTQLQAQKTALEATLAGLQASSATNEAARFQLAIQRTEITNKLLDINVRLIAVQEAWAKIDEITNKNAEKSLDKQIERVGVLTFLYGQYVDVLAKVNASQTQLQGTLAERAAARISTQGVALPPKPIIPVPTEQELKENFAEFNAIAQGAANGMRTAFMQVWDDIFGHANNLFTVFIQNVIQELIALQARQLASSIFGFLVDIITPNSVVGAVPDLLPGITGKKGNVQVINVNVGDQQVAQVVVDGNRQSERLRL